MILNILVNTYLDLFCLVNKFDEKGHLITKSTRTDSFYGKSKFRFTRNFYFFDIPNEDSYSDLTFEYEATTNPEYLITDELKGFFNLNRERTINKIKFIKHDKDRNSSLVYSKV